MAKPATVIVIWLAATLALPSFGWLGIAVARWGRPGPAEGSPRAGGSRSGARWLLLPSGSSWLSGTPGRPSCPFHGRLPMPGSTWRDSTSLRLVLLLGFLALLFRPPSIRTGWWPACGRWPVPCGTWGGFGSRGRPPWPWSSTTWNTLRPGNLAPGARSISTGRDSGPDTIRLEPWPGRPGRRPDSGRAGHAGASWAPCHENCSGPP